LNTYHTYVTFFLCHEESKFFVLRRRKWSIPVIGFDVPTPKLKFPVVVVAMGNPVAATVDTFAGSNASPVAADMGDPLLARFVKLGRLDTVDMDVVVAVTPPARPKPAPAAMVDGVPKVKLVSPCNTKSQHQST